MMWKLRMRLTSSWLIAPRTPVTMVSPATASSSVDGSLSVNNSVWLRMIAYTPTLVRRPANMAVTGEVAAG